ncbi:MAG: 16S rRNA (cytidine(1402)-2'-O)-methyltransferase [Desulfocapsaceae bacterium]|jgi:16S rRNA (cytidine1402-2'-O)-methyltransferase|nr:16S rRNA (cytidine(1402)-2'-O)-methyltransferase [Desulfocapsaceae bacterium]
MTGSLYIVATPIGNLEDITHRALRVLGEVDLIAAEDTRHTRKLLSHFNITTDLVSYYREKESQRSGELVTRMIDGADIALVSDAGTPAISDPGSVLVNEARKQGIRIIPIPGPSALSAALSCAGLTPGSFLFLGFPPAKSGQRRQMLTSLSNAEYPLVFYKSPHRIKRFIADAQEILGNRKILWAREITKKYEDIAETSLSQLSETLHEKKIRGEIVVIIHPGRQELPTGETIDEILDWYYRNSELSMKDVCRKVATDMGVSRSDMYRKALEIWKKQ